MAYAFERQGVAVASKILERIAPGIYRTASGFRVKVSVGSRVRGGLSDEQAFPSTAGIKEMKGWQVQRRAELSRQMIRPALGTLEADIPRYLKAMSTLAFPDSREDEIMAWCDRFGSRGRHTIKPDEIRRQVDDWLNDAKHRAAPSTVRHRMTALSMLYRTLDGDNAPNPVRGLSRPKERKPKLDAPPLAVVGEVLDALAARVVRTNRGWLTFARVRLIAFTGMRHSQVMRLTRHDFALDADPPYILVADPGKDGEPHSKPLFAEGIDAARLFLRVGRFGKFSQSSVYKSWKTACEDAGVPFFNPYKLRHAYATALRAEGMDLADVQQVLGHKSAKTTERYAAVSPSKVAAAAEMLERAWKRARG